MHATQRCALGLTLIAVASLTPRPAGASAQVAAGLATPVQAVAVLLESFYRPLAQSTCQAITGRYAHCRITARLRYRLQHPDRVPGTVNPLCRCQNFIPAIRWAQVDNNGFVAHVNTLWPPTLAITFVVARQDDGWVVDDNYCAGRPATSLYHIPIGPCMNDGRGAVGAGAGPTPWPAPEPAPAAWPSAAAWREPTARQALA
jgi:hypothetical protein